MDIKKTVKTIIIIVIIIVILYYAVMSLMFMTAESSNGRRLNTPEMKELRTKLMKLPPVKSVDIRLRFLGVEIQMTTKEATEETVESIMEIVEAHFNEQASLGNHGEGLKIELCIIQDNEYLAIFSTDGKFEENKSLTWKRNHYDKE